MIMPFFLIRVMLTSNFRVFVNNLVKENFYEKRKVINILTVFLFSKK